MKRQLLYTAILSLSLTTSIFAQSYGPPSPRPYNQTTVISIGDSFPNELANRLNLSENQRTEIRHINSQARDKAQEISYKMASNQRELDSLSGKNYNEKKVAKITKNKASYTEKN